MKEWWRAGIPFDEAADWIGAGLSVQEAVEQRAKGITAEHAATLRALRREEAPKPPAGQSPTGRSRTALPQPGQPPTSLWRTGPPAPAPTGPPPVDEEAARSQIVDAFSGMLTPDESFTAVPAVEGGANLGQCLARAVERVATNDPVVSKVTAGAIQFLNDHEARVSYDIDVTGGFTLRLSNRVGRAVLVEGTWKVARETFCRFMQMAGAPCPPREGTP